MSLKTKFQQRQQAEESYNDAGDMQQK